MSRQKSHDKSQSQPFVDKFQTQLEQCTTQQAALLRGRLHQVSCGPLPGSSSWQFGAPMLEKSVAVPDVHIAIIVECAVVC